MALEKASITQNELLAHSGQEREDAISLLRLTGQSMVHAAIQQPLDGVTQLVNVSAPKLIDAPRPTEFGSKRWLAETVGAGFGMVLPFLLVQKASGACLARIGTMAEQTTIGKSLAALSVNDTVRFTAPAAKMALDGALYGLALTPTADSEKGFWQQRAVAAGSSALTFGTMGLAARGLGAGVEALGKISLAESAGKHIGLRLATNAAAGAAGGFVSAESNSLLHGQGFASTDQIGKSMVSFMVTGLALDGAHIAGETLRDARAEAKALTEARTEALKPPSLSAAENKMLDNIQQAHFEYFVRESDPVTGLTKDRSTEQSPASIAAVGFSLTAHGVAAERGWITREQAADYTYKVLDHLWKSPQGDQAQGVSGHRGLFYHFLDPKTGLRTGTNELSTIDTALLMGGVLYSKNFFNGTNARETQIRALADNLYKRVDWNWAMNSNGRLSMGWTPENGFIPADWQGYNEAPILMMLAMGSPTHPIAKESWSTYASTNKVSDYYGQKVVEFGPLFGHQYPQIWLDFRGIKDATNQKLGFDYFENSRRAAQIQQQYAIENPKGYRGYGSLDWGLTASDGPGEVVKEVDGKQLQFHSYDARGFPNAPDDGTIAPTAAAASLPFAPEIVMPTLKHWVKERPELLGPEGFADAFNPTFDKTKPSGWVDAERLGIDQGPIVLMLENYRSGSIWRTMNADPYINEGLKKAGFTGRQFGQPVGLNRLIVDMQKMLGTAKPT